MFPRFLAALLALSFMGTATAQSRPKVREGETRFIELSADSRGEEPEVLISPGLSTNFNFDADLLRTQCGEDSVALEAREAFKLVDPGLASLRLVPSDRLKPGARLRLQVRFKDGADPASAAFTLVVSEARAEQVVEVYRDARPVESYRQETRQANAAAAKCLDELERTRTEHSGPGGLVGLLASQQVDKEGVRTRVLGEVITPAPVNALTVWGVVSYRSVVHVAVELLVRAPEGMQPWTAEGATLVGQRGKESKTLTVWQAGSVTGEPGQRARVVVGADASQADFRGTYTLKVWDAGARRVIILGNVTFP